MKKVLIVDCMPPEYDPLLDSLRVPRISESEQAMLKLLQPGIECHVARAADPDEPLPQRQQLEAFDGVLWSGTPLSVLDEVPGMHRQIELMRTVFGTGRPVFGICGGLQVGIAVAGGKIARNPLGLESGICRSIRPTPAGARHPMFQFRDGPFDAIGDHFDHAEELPAGAGALAGNDACAVQAVAFRAGASDFWGVQYHPDFGLDHLRLLAKLRGDACRGAEPGRPYPGEILDPLLRAAEVRAWLQTHRTGDA